MSMRTAMHGNSPVDRGSTHRSRRKETQEVARTTVTRVQLLSWQHGERLGPGVRQTTALSGRGWWHQDDIQQQHGTRDRRPQAATRGKTTRQQRRPISGVATTAIDRDVVDDGGAPVKADG
ncbi:hypothetical protein E2562_004403 [Oryza meyeriana var. granulata]|uniref:Uncharacterized protein n=1 Tax=Oryza meyeriana var. granulata TaxID=110450 RepID=A0A6G1CZB4_9ORYZ|nr:hypothetical protein E2562_004403 [Oryza meyeriana var. granulata]